jgi:ribosomal protein L7Ae-like RNA K-turn-binding protein
LVAQDDVLRKALKQGAFAKAARGSVGVPGDLHALIVSGLRQRILDFLGFARRSGEAVAGREAVLDWLRHDKVALLIQASDGSPAERSRLIGGRAVDVVGERTDGLDFPVLTPLTAAELGGVFGRERAVHVAVSPGRMVSSLQAEAARLAGFTSDRG